MALLQLVLEEGFEDETIAVQLDGREVLREEHVKTRLQIGRAAVREIPIGEDPVEVKILIPDRQLSETLRVHTSEKVYVYCSILPDRIDCRVSATESSFYA